jgi:hypothetical protein
MNMKWKLQSQSQEDTGDEVNMNCSCVFQHSSHANII